MSDAPELGALVADPALAADVSTDHVPGLLAQLVAEQAKLAALEGALVLRLLTASGRGNGRDETAGMLSVAEAAKRATLSPTYFYDHADRLPFMRRVGRRVLVHEATFQRWLDRGAGIK